MPARVRRAPAPVPHVSRTGEPFDEPPGEPIRFFAALAANQKLQLERTGLERERCLLLETSEDRPSLREIADAQSAAQVAHEDGDGRSGHRDASYDTKPRCKRRNDPRSESSSRSAHTRRSCGSRNRSPPAGSATPPTSPTR